MTIKLHTSQQKTSAPDKAVHLPDDNNFPYGWRQVTETLPDGQTAYRRVPLIPADFLDPQEGDQLIQGSIHVRQRIALYNMLDNYYLDKPTVAVFCDMKMRWGIPGLKEPAPDIAVVPNISDKYAARQSFEVIEEGTRPCLIIEVVSPNYAGDDTDKVAIYEEAGVAEYIIVDPHAKQEEKRQCELSGYRLAGSTYRPLVPDADGRLFSETTGLWIGLDERKQWVQLTDAASGERLLTAEEEKTTRQAAEARAAALEARLRDLEARLGQAGAEGEA